MLFCPFSLYLTDILQPEDIAVDRSLFSQERFEVSSIGCNLMSGEILSHIFHQEVVVTGKGKVRNILDLFTYCL